VIHDVDESLRTMITARAMGRADVDVVFDAPTREWASRRTGPTINSFLYDIREDVGRRDVASLSVRDDTGRVVGRRPPPRRFRLAYLLTAWTQRPEDEHRLLAALLSTFLRADRIPTEMLAGSLADAGVPVILQLALPPPQDRSLSDVWSALGGEMKPSLDLVVIAPIDPMRTIDVGPPVLEPVTLRIASGGRRDST
jgi:Pvc16 N-terminal domain